MTGSSSQRIVLASHGTPGARAAERTALALAAPGASVFHLVVVPEFWKGMMGDDWLNNVATRDVYARYVESRLAAEINSHLESLAQDLEGKGIHYESSVVLGNPAECLITYSGRIQANLVVIGSPRPRGKPGLRSRMRVDRILSAIRTPLLVVPHPG